MSYFYTTQILSKIISSSDTTRCGLHLKQPEPHVNPGTAGQTTDVQAPGASGQLQLFELLIIHTLEKKYAYGSNRFAIQAYLDHVPNTNHSYLVAA